MSAVNEAGFASALGITVRQLWTLRANPQFPAPQMSDPAGQNSAWTTSLTPYVNFLANWNSALAHGWKLPCAILATANIAAMAAAAPGVYCRNLVGTDPLWEI